MNNDKTQYFPAINVDRFGSINIVFFDDRNTTDDSSGVFLSRSTDGGDSWNEFEISDHNYKPTPVIASRQGDNIDITSTSSKLWPVWMDNSTGIYQIWTAPIEFITVDVEDFTPAPSSFELKQNYPNPFNPTTTIGYQIQEQRFVSLILYDALGNELVKLVREHKISGYYEVEFRNTKLLKNKDLSSGIYFHRLSVNGNYDTKSMLLVK